MENINEDCGCQGTTDNIRTAVNTKTSKYEQDPLVGKRVSLIDGREGLVDDSIRNGTGEVIGYVIEGVKGNYRVFKNKICSELNEDKVKEQEGGADGGFASLDSTPGMGAVSPPLPDGTPGSGDKFPTLTAGTPAAKGKKTKKRSRKKPQEPKMDPHKLDTSIMTFDKFMKSTKSNQNKD